MRQFLLPKHLTQNKLLFTPLGHFTLMKLRPVGVVHPSHKRVVHSLPTQLLVNDSRLNPEFLKLAFPLRIHNPVNSSGNLGALISKKRDRLLAGSHTDLM